MNRRNKKCTTGPHREAIGEDHPCPPTAPLCPPGPCRAKERFEEGKSELRENNYREAEKLFGLAMYYDSQVPVYHFYQGLAMLGRDAYEDAECAFERAYALEPENADYAAELGFVCLKMGSPERALFFFRDALRSEPNHGMATEGMRRLNPKKALPQHKKNRSAG